ncbi:MAG: 3-methyl-2-oxobutanoate hydroxymethyltransferase [Actinobacteria bacterium]|nr:3-methyl-2-oxobutanoate hydroxymethyltransferase [Actinomycetota bacterium]
MSSVENKQVKNLTINDIQDMKDRNEKIVVHSPMDYNTALMVEEAGADLIIIGDSLPTMILGGEPYTFCSTMDEVIFFVSRISQAVKRAVVIAGMPYGSLQESNEQAIHNAIQLVKAGAHSVKIQGATKTILKRIRSIIDVGIPCMGHVGMMPHFIRQIGGFKSIGKTCREALQVYNDVKELERIGVWSIEIECVAQKVAHEISKRTRIPLIGIGSGVGTDGQSLCFHDILGLQKKIKPKHSKCYVDIWSICVKALNEFSREVKESNFPTADHSFQISDEEFNEFLNNLK